MKRHIEKTRASLGDLGALAAKTEADERDILDRAEKRHAAVLREIEELRPGVEVGTDSKQDQYLDLVAERGMLELVISKARTALSR